MSVYTALDQETLTTYIDSFRIGPLKHFEGALDGIENTTYFITTDQSHLKSEDSTAEEGHYVLTVFETLTEEQLPFFIELTTNLQEQELPVPSPLRDINGKAMQLLANKPALLFPRISGEHPTHPSEAQCAAIGDFLGKMHSITMDSEVSRANNRGFNWCCEEVKNVEGDLSQEDLTLLEDTITHLKPIFADPWSLPRGITHGDLFRDNSLYLNNELLGVIDFYNASTEFFLFDLAITVNDWCSNKDGTIHEKRYKSLVSAYQEQRPLLDSEKAAWPHLLQAAALRFWMSRLLVKYAPTENPKGILTQHKDPDDFKIILMDRRKKTAEI